jgi:hypothetical protein
LILTHSPLSMSQAEAGIIASSTLITPGLGGG